VNVIGTVFGDRWEVLAPLARGSTSVVYRGIDQHNKTPVAIKVLQSQYAANQESVARFEREARVAQEVSHPNIVSVLGHGVDFGFPWIAMELLEGETLETLLCRERLPMHHVVQVIEQIAAAVDHAHTCGVVHRDLKPDNCFVLVTQGPVQIKVLDFGFAKILNALEGDGLRTASNALLGTPLYMAPEQIRSSATVDHRADLWSLGVVAYELLTASPPFETRVTADLLVEILTRSIPPPSQLDTALPIAVDRWASRALERDPDRRFRTATELARSLRSALDPAHARATAVTTSRHAAVQGHTRPRWFTAVLVCVAVMVVIALVIAAQRP
jgi:eukaryotic-like serine/threonine-protein kinase